MITNVMQYVIALTISDTGFQISTPNLAITTVVTNCEYTV